MKSSKKNRLTRLILVGIFGISLFLILKPYFKTMLNDNKIDKEKEILKIKLSNLGGVLTESGTVQISNPKIIDNETTISDYEVILNIGESISYVFDVVNNGNVDAKLSEMVIPTPVCASTDPSNPLDVSELCKNVTYKLTYSSGQGNTYVSNNDTINAGATKHMMITLTYNYPTDHILLNAEPILIKNLGITLNYIKI